MKTVCNADLQKLRPGASTYLSLPPLTTHGGAHLYLPRTLLLPLYKTLVFAASPLNRLIACYLWSGRSILALTHFTERVLLGIIGWLYGKAFREKNPIARFFKFYFAADVRRWHMAMASAVAGGVLTTIVQRIANRFDEGLKKRKALEKMMTQAESYEQWRNIAGHLSRTDTRTPATGGFDSGRGGNQSDVFDRNLLINKTAHLRELLASPSVRDIIFSLRIDLLRNVANIAHSRLHEKFYKIPQVIHEYLHEVKKGLIHVRDWPESDMCLEEKLNFFRETRHAFGRTALLLSGGGALGMFHLGVCKSLFERRLLPRVLAGSSAGSIVCAAIGMRTDAELRVLFATIENYDFSLFRHSKAYELVKNVFQKGTLHDMSYLVMKLRVLIGDLTFQEGYERTGRILNVTVCPADTKEPARLLNYLTAPHALVWSAVAASSAFPGLYDPQHLLARNAARKVVPFSTSAGDNSLERRWRDGSLEIDLPTKALGEMFNCNHFVVSQTNPHIVPLLNLKKALPNMMGDVLQAELKHRCVLLEMMLPKWFPTTMIKLFTQPWEGDVTITLPAELWSLGNALTNHSVEGMNRFVKMGELAAWEKVSAIECNCTIEATLDMCVQKLAMKHMKENKSMAVMNSRILSWTHMPTHGLPPVASWCNASGSDMATVASWGGNKQSLRAAQSSAELKQRESSASPATSPPSTPNETDFLDRHGRHGSVSNGEPGNVPNGGPATSPDSTPSDSNHFPSPNHANPDSHRRASSSMTTAMSLGQLGTKQGRSAQEGVAPPPHGSPAVSPTKVPAPPQLKHSAMAGGFLNKHGSVPNGTGSINKHGSVPNGTGFLNRHGRHSSSSHAHAGGSLGGRSRSVSESLGAMMRGGSMDGWGGAEEAKKREEEEAHKLQDMIALAQVDCCDPSAGEVWSQLMPMSNKSRNRPSYEMDGIDEDDVFAY